MGGVGEVLDPCPALPRTPIVLVNPGFPLPTREVFAARQGPFAPGGRFDTRPRDGKQLSHILSSRENNLTAAAISCRPEIADVLTALERAAGCMLSRMLGSGATCLGLFAEEDQAAAASSALGAHHPGWWVRAGHFCVGCQGAGFG
jgi:4-diphosphocytidyl-2-C-methyl-D-erythritol kinase